MNSEKNVEVIYLDFSRAFDKEDHLILLQKIKKLHIKGKTFNWLKNFLSHRSQIVVVDGAESRPESVISGVPQGTVLGPLLFLIMINDLPDVLKHCSVSSFADDTKISKKIVCSDDYGKVA